MKGESTHVLAFYPPHLPASSMPPLYEWFLANPRRKVKGKKRTTFARLADPLVWQGRPRPRSAPAARRRPRQAWTAFHGEVGSPGGGVDSGPAFSRPDRGRARSALARRRRPAPFHEKYDIPREERLRENRII